MKNRSYQLSGSRFLMTGTALVIVAGTLAATAFNPFKALKRARMAEHVSNAKQVKLSLDVFAMDHDGVYPSADTAGELGLPDEFKWSNDAFREVFAGEYMNSEKVFWVKGAKVCNLKEPDDVTTEDGKFSAAETLQSGDCGWAYIADRTNTDNPSRPIVLDAYTPGTSDFDAKIWDGKVIVARNDGSVILQPIDVTGKLLVDGEDILSAKSALWKDSGFDPAKDLLQPQPAEKAEAKEDGADKDVPEAEAE